MQNCRREQLTPIYWWTRDISPPPPSSSLPYIPLQSRCSHESWERLPRDVLRQQQMLAAGTGRSVVVGAVQDSRVCAQNVTGRITSPVTKLAYFTGENSLCCPQTHIALAVASRIRYFLSGATSLAQILRAYCTQTPNITWQLSRALVLQLTVIRKLGRKSRPPRISQRRRFMEFQGSLPRSQEPSTAPYPKPHHSSPHHPILSL
jgi:hypothetical protein